MINSRLAFTGLAVTVAAGAMAIGSVSVPATADPGPADRPVATPASPPPAPNWDRVQIRSVATNGALVPFGGGTDAGRVVDMIALWPSSPEAQQWQLVAAGTSGGATAYQVKNRKAAGMCLEAKKSLVNNGRYDTWIQTCDTTEPEKSQLWVPKASPQQSSHYQIFSAKHTGKALTPDALNSHNVGVWIRTPTNTNAFSWTIDAVY